MDLKQCSDEELIVRYRDGDTDAMDFIFERYKHLVRKKAKAMFLAGGDNDDLIQEGMITRTCIKSRKPFLFRFRRWEILKRQNYAKNGLPKFATRHSAQTGKFRKPNA